MKHARVAPIRARHRHGTPRALHALRKHRARVPSDHRPPSLDVLDSPCNNDQRRGQRSHPHGHQQHAALHAPKDARPTPRRAEYAFVKQVVSSLVVVPGHPDHGPFYLVLGLLNALPKYAHWQPHTGAKADALLALVPLLAAYAQRRLPYAAAGVEANDVLYGGAPEYLQELQAHLGKVVNAVVAELTALGADDDQGHPPSDAKLQKRALLVLDLVNVLVGAVDVSPDGDAGKFARKLLGLASKHKDASALKDYYLNTKKALERAGNAAGQ